MAVINTNVNAIIARNAGAVNERSMTNAMQQLSTGKRINVAADDAAGLAISTKMTSQIRGLDQAIRNANDGISMLQVVEGATVEMTNMLQRMRELAVQSANDTNTSAERSYLDDEFQELRAEIDRIASTTQWNGKNVMDGTDGIGTDNASGDVGGQTMAYQVGANASQTISFDVGNFSTGSALTEGIVNLTFAADATEDYGGFTLTRNGSDYALNVADIDASSTTQSDWDTVATNVQAAIDEYADLDGNVTVTAIGPGVLQFTDATGYDLTFGTFLQTDDTTASTDTPATTTYQAGATSGGNGVFGAADLENQEITTQALSATAISKLDTALTALNEQRSAIGATINRLTYAADNLTNTSANVNAARSRVLDTDYAQATTELARTQIIQQASTAMLAQANQGAQSVLSLLK